MYHRNSLLYLLNRGCYEAEQQIHTATQDEVRRHWTLLDRRRQRRTSEVHAGSSPISPPTVRKQASHLPSTVYDVTQGRFYVGTGSRAPGFKN